MQNVLMQVCRETHRYNQRQIADKLGMIPADYVELEMSVVAMTPAQAEKLAAIYNIDQEHFLESSRQLELLLAQAEVIKHSNKELERFRKFIFVHKELFLDSMRGNEIEGVNKNADNEQETIRQ